MTAYLTENWHSTALPSSTDTWQYFASATDVGTLISGRRPLVSMSRLGLGTQFTWTHDVKVHPLHDLCFIWTHNSHVTGNKRARRWGEGGGKGGGGTVNEWGRGWERETEKRGGGGGRNRGVVTGCRWLGGWGGGGADRRGRYYTWGGAKWELDKEMWRQREMTEKKREREGGREREGERERDGEREREMEREREGEGERETVGQTVKDLVWVAGVF